MSRITQPAGWILLFVDYSRQSSNLKGLSDWPQPFSPARGGPDSMEVGASRHQTRAGGGGRTAVLSPGISNQPSCAQSIPTTRSWILAAFDEVSWSGAYALWYAVARSTSLVVVALV